MKIDRSLKISVAENVYPPSDDSELLIESLEIFSGEKLLEIGCGSGIVAMHCARNGADVTAVDINPDAVECTKNNCRENSIALKCFVSDVFENVEGVFDTIVFNLPYLPVEEDGLLEKSWSGGKYGVEPLPRLLKDLKKHLKKDGKLVVVVSTLTDGKKLSELLENYNVEVLGEKPFFFEKIKVLKITQK